MSVAATTWFASLDHSERSVPSGKYWRRRPLVFSLVPRCQALFGSAKKTAMPVFDSEIPKSAATLRRRKPGHGSG